MLGSSWEASNDLAITATGDATGFHVMAARAGDGYAWHTIATLSEPGMDTDQWVGNACLTSSGRQVVATYAPRHFTNRAWLFSRGAFAAVIDVKSGKITKLEDQVSLAYYNPGCGSDDKVALTQGTTEERMTTRLLTVDTSTKSVSRPILLDGQITSATAVADHIVAARGNKLVKVAASGKLKTLATTDSVPFGIRPTADGGVAFMDQAGGAVSVKHYRNGSVRVLASGRLGEVSLHSGTSGRVFITGKTRQHGPLPSHMSAIGGAPNVETVSSEGDLLITSIARRGLRRDSESDQADTRYPGVVQEDPAPELIDITAQTARTHSPLTFAIDPTREATSPSGREENPRLAEARGQAESKTTATSTGTIDPNHSCAIARNDPNTQVYQPHWRQVEWAVDQLVFKDRLQVWRQDNWKESGLSSWNPQDLFSAPDLAGGGRIPVSVVFGILAQESNLWQAQRDTLPGETGNPLVGNYYGVEIYDDKPDNDWVIRWDEADCGYGLTQQTDHMRRAGHAKPGEWLWDPDTQRRIALDYVTNIAVGLTTLAEKWNQIYTDTGGTMKINNGDPSKIENWYFAIWAYNSGYYPKAQASANGGAWGVGWANNPKNPDYVAGRRPFLDNNSYSDAAHPQDWPYQEKVLGWSAWPIAKTYYNAATGEWVTEGGYNYAWWNSEGYRSSIVPGGTLVDENAFCSAENECDPADTTRGCTRADWKCWWHSAKTWKTCPQECGNEAFLRYDASYAGIERSEPSDQWTTCLTPGLPQVTGDTKNVLIVDDVPDSVPAVRGGCDNSGWANSGALTFEFEQDSAGEAPGRADFGQLGNGFGGHLWYGYTRNSSHLGDPMKVTGTWELNQPINGWARVLVHVPKRRAETQQAPYTVHLGNGQTRTRYLSQGRLENHWQNLGVFEFKGVPKVALTNRNQEGDGTAAVAWDAIAFQVLAKKPKHFVVGMGDSFASGEGVGNYYPETDTGYKRSTWNACRRSKDAWIRQTVLPGETQTVGQLADSFDPRLDFSFVACSGAVTRDMTVPEYTYTTVPFDWSAYRGSAEGRFREAAQLESGYLDENTTLVALSIGGNDANFSPVVTNCFLLPCYSEGYENDIKADVTAAVFNKMVGTEEANVKNIVESIDSRVQNYSPARGKKAQIVLMGYPEITGTGVLDCGAFDPDEQNMMQRMAEHFSAEENKMVQTAKAAGVEVSFANPMPAFQGHGACKPEGERWITPVTFAKTGPGDFGDVDDVWSGCMFDGFRCASRTSMHPNAAGARAYAGVLTTHLQALGYTGW
ncbi:SGNH/GDSL hydrolase family protein [Nonomuraea sp. NPDC049504]|uniref:SGNH/GDSL hydrolase family protein n=1 Tax=Nonomuraea sp. NPDC049504 TaxID=3154729 RepID=UPI00341F5A0A